MSPPNDVDAAPSQKTMQFLKIRNNISRRNLKQQLDMIEREKTFNLMSITHDSLDLKEFLRKVKKCPSEDLPEAKHWLGRRRAVSARAPTDDNGIPRDIATAPVEVPSDPDPVATKHATDDEPDHIHAYTDIKRGAPATGMQLSYMKLFGRRNAYADVTADTTDTFSDLFAKTPSQTASGRRTGLSDYSDAVDTVVVDNRRTPGSVLSSAASGKRVNILVLDDKTRGRRGRRRGGSPEPDEEEEGGDLMKNLLTDKSRRRQRHRRRRRTPLPDRISEFYGKLDKLKKEENAPPSKEFHRRWIMFTRGVDAALAESSEEEEDVLHTI